MATQPSAERPRGLREAYSHFFEDPSRDRLAALLRDHVGELRNLDFKEQWIDNSALAKQCLAMFNTKGGVLVFGVKENDDGTAEPVGLKKLKDKADFTNGIKKFLPSEVLAQVSVWDFPYETSDYAKIAGMTFQVVFIVPEDKFLPAVSMRSGKDIDEAAIYVRREGRVEEASFSEIQGLIDRKIKAIAPPAEQIDTKHHLDQIKALYEAIPKYHTNPRWFMPGAGLLDIMGRTNNPAHPEEGYEAYVARILEDKKGAFEDFLGVRGRSKPPETMPRATVRPITPPGGSLIDELKLDEPPPAPTSEEPNS